MDDKQLAEVERDIASEASPKGAAMVRALAEEVRRLRVVLEVKEAHAIEAAKALHAACNRSIVARRAERERCAKVVRSFFDTLDCGPEVRANGEILATHLERLPDEPTSEET